MNLSKDDGEMRRFMNEIAVELYAIRTRLLKRRFAVTHAKIGDALQELGWEAARRLDEVRALPPPRKKGKAKR